MKKAVVKLKTRFHLIFETRTLDSWIIEAIILTVTLVGSYLFLAMGSFSRNIVSDDLLTLLVFTFPLYLILLSVLQGQLSVFRVRKFKEALVSGLLLALTSVGVSFVLDAEMLRLIPIVIGVIYLSVWGFTRVLTINFERYRSGGSKASNRILIYGAGEAGAQIVAALRMSEKDELVGFVDDNKLKQGCFFCELPVYSPHEIEMIVQRAKVSQILIAIPSISIVKRDEIISCLKGLPCDIAVMPLNVDIIQKNNILKSLVSVSDDLLLGRGELIFKSDPALSLYKGKTILVSGAGGSIGKELCRQILNHSPSTLILYDQSELALYEIELELRPLVLENKSIKIIPLLGDVCDANSLEAIFTAYEVQVVFHAAAYKHVPLVEANVVAGVKNNIFGTYEIAKQSMASSVETFILVSSDKAVRPRNVMGATKRIAEIIVQDFDKASKKTKFSIVRFGNVVSSSGSVVPLFKSQIAQGGPITLTHKDVTRYFMATSEAAHLLIEAGGLAGGGEVFVLDMGAPVRIFDLAKNLIEKNNLTILDEENPGGDIEIKTIGLRPGEKLFEELLIEESTITPPHPKILVAKERSLTSRQVAKLLKMLRQGISNNDADYLRKVLFEWVKHRGRR